MILDRQTVIAGVKTDTRYLTCDEVIVVQKQGDQIFFDACDTPAEHMALPLKSGEDKRRCRKHLNDVIPDEWFGRKGVITVAVMFTPAEDLKLP